MAMAKVSDGEGNYWAQRGAQNDFDKYLNSEDINERLIDERKLAMKATMRGD